VKWKRFASNIKATNSANKVYVSKVLIESEMLKASINPSLDLITKR